MAWNCSRVTTVTSGGNAAMMASRTSSATAPGSVWTRPRVTAECLRSGNIRRKLRSLVISAPLMPKELPTSNRPPMRMRLLFISSVTVSAVSSIATMGPYSGRDSRSNT